MSNKNIKDLNLSTKVKNILLNKNIQTLDDLSKLDLDSLMKIKKLGRKGIKEILQTLNSNGYKYEGIIEYNKEESVLTLEELSKIENKDIIPIKNIEMSTRLYNILIINNIQTIGDLKSYDLDSLMKIKNLGRKAIEEILQILNACKYINDDKNKIFSLKNK